MQRGLMAAILLLCFRSRWAGADECPLATLQQAAKAETELGAWEIQAWSPRMDFPRLTDQESVRAAAAGVWRMPAECDTRLTVRSAGLEFWVPGYTGNPIVDGWFPVVVFTPKAPGLYTVSGTLKLSFTGDAADTNAVEWAVAKVRPGPRFKVLAGGRAGRGAEVALQEEAALKTVNLAAGESLGIAVWRSSHRYVGGGKLIGLAVSRAGGK